MWVWTGSLVSEKPTLLRYKFLPSKGVSLCVSNYWLRCDCGPRIISHTYLPSLMMTRYFDFDCVLHRVCQRTREYQYILPGQELTYSPDGEALTLDSLSGRHLRRLLNLSAAFPCLLARQQWFILCALATRSTAGLKDDCPPEQGNKPWHDGVRIPSWSREQTLSQAQRRELTFNQSKAIHIAVVMWKPCNSNFGDFFILFCEFTFLLCVPLWTDDATFSVEIKTIWLITSKSNYNIKEKTNKNKSLKSC